MSNEMIFVAIAFLAVADIVAGVLLAKKLDNRDDTKELAIFLQSKL